MYDQHHEFSCIRRDYRWWALWIDDCSFAGSRRDQVRCPREETGNLNSSQGYGHFAANLGTLPAAWFVRYDQEWITGGRRPFSFHLGQIVGW
jgi:hypothetical protein